MVGLVDGFLLSSPGVVALDLLPRPLPPDPPLPHIPVRGRAEVRCKRTEVGRGSGCPALRWAGNWGRVSSPPTPPKAGWGDHQPCSYKLVPNFTDDYDGCDGDAEHPKEPSCPEKTDFLKIRPCEIFLKNHFFEIHFLSFKKLVSQETRFSKKLVFQKIANTRKENINVQKKRQCRRVLWGAP